MTSEPEDLPRALVAGHAEVAAGLISAVEQISGRGHRFVALSNSGLAPGAIEENMRAALASSGARIIFTDLPAGSCTMAAMRIVRSDPSLTLVTGVGLPTLLAFACGCDVATATERGREAQKVIEVDLGP